MKIEPNRTHTIEFVKREATRLKKELEITHHEALEKISQQCGFSNYQDFLNSTPNVTRNG